LVASGWTSIGAGVRAADTQLDGFPGEPVRAMIVMTDGQQNVDPEPISFINNEVDPAVRIYTIGFGSDADAQLLSQMADLRNGQYYFAPSTDKLREIYFVLAGTLSGQQLLTRTSGNITQGSTQSANVLIDPSITQVRFGVDWGGSDIDLALVDPYGIVIDHDNLGSYSNVSLSVADTYEFYTVNSPAPGTWTMRIEGVTIPAGGENYHAYATATAAIRMSASTDRNAYWLHDTVRITASLSDGAPILDASIVASVTAPDGAVPPSTDVPLYDDGAHGDGMANDGLYANDFTGLNWAGNYTVTVSANGVANGGASFARTSYQSIAVDDDARPAVQFTAESQAELESDSELTITAQLSAILEEDVTVPFTVAGIATIPDDYTITGSPMTIPAGSTTATITINMVNDAVDEVDETIIVTMGVPTNAVALGTTVHIATILDNDTAGITVTPTSEVVTTESGGTATFTVVLDSEPTADVTIGLSSSVPTEGTVSPPSLTFTSSDWNTPKMVTVTGVNDDIDDGNVAYTIVTSAASSGDPNYDALDAANVSVTNTDDNNTAGITVTPTSGLTTTESGDTAEFTVVLDTKPTANVTVTVTSNDVTEGTVLPSVLTFTPENWNLPQTVTVTGVDDEVEDGNTAYTIVTAASSNDNKYDGLDVADVSVTNTDDNDSAGIIVTPTSGLITTETGDTASFTVRLNSEPTSDVTIALSSGDTTEGIVSPATLVFTAASWNVPQIVTVAGMDDEVDDGDVAYTIVTAAAVSDDPHYSGVNAADVSVSNTDKKSIVPVDLGRVDFRRLESLNPGAGELWFQMEATHDGWLTIKSVHAWTATQLSLGLYNPSDLTTPLATSAASDATPRIDHSVTESQIYLLRVTGSASNVSLLLANLVHEAGSAVTVHGTTAADEFVFDGAASREIMINGVEYHYEDTQVTMVDFNGGDGDDSATLTGGPDTEIARFFPDHGTFGENGFLVTLNNVTDPTRSTSTIRRETIRLSLAKATESCRATALCSRPSTSCTTTPMRQLATAAAT
jgi:hypothetical protein